MKKKVALQHHYVDVRSRYVLYVHMSAAGTFYMYLQHHYCQQQVRSVCTYSITIVSSRYVLYVLTAAGTFCMYLQQQVRSVCTNSSRYVQHELTAAAI